jgi:hypothetical protein
MSKCARTRKRGRKRGRRDDTALDNVLYWLAGGQAVGGKVVALIPFGVLGLDGMSMGFWVHCIALRRVRTWVWEVIVLVTHVSSDFFFYCYHCCMIYTG